MIPKFRAWHKNKKQMLEVITIMFNHEYMWVKPIGDEEGHVNETLVLFDDVILMQSTGLKDKNGVEIWEGDIVITYNEYIGKIIYQDGEYCIYMKWNSDIGTKRKPNIISNNDTESLKAFAGSNSEFIAVIRNIYEEVEE